MLDKLTGTDTILLAGIVAMAWVCYSGLRFWHVHQVRLADDRLFHTDAGAAHLLGRCFDQCSAAAAQEIMARFEAADPAVKRQMAAAAVGYKDSPEGRQALEAGDESYEQTLLAVIRGLSGERPVPSEPPPVVIEGRAQVRSVAPLPGGGGVIAAVEIMSGSLRRGAGVRVVRDGLLIRSSATRPARIGEVRIEATEVEQAQQGECGVLVAGIDELRVADVLELCQKS
jgi:hypothetical protein